MQKLQAKPAGLTGKNCRSKQRHFKLRVLARAAPGGSLGEIHAKLFTMALEAWKQGHDLTGVDFFLCPVWGIVKICRAHDACAICGAKGDSFIER